LRTGFFIKTKNLNDLTLINRTSELENRLHRTEIIIHDLQFIVIHFMKTLGPSKGSQCTNYTVMNPQNKRFTNMFTLPSRCCLHYPGYVYILPDFHTPPTT